jgi:hypothetical protein
MGGGRGREQLILQFGYHAVVSAVLYIRVCFIVYDPAWIKHFVEFVYITSNHERDFLETSSAYSSLRLQPA